MSSQFFAFLVAKALLDEKSRVEQERNQERCGLPATETSPGPCQCTDCDPGPRRAVTEPTAQKA